MSTLRGGGGVEQLGRRKLVAADVERDRAVASISAAIALARARAATSRLRLSLALLSIAQQVTSASSSSAATDVAHERRIDRGHLLRRRRERRRDVGGRCRRARSPFFARVASLSARSSSVSSAAPVPDSPFPIPAGTASPTSARIGFHAQRGRRQHARAKRQHDPRADGAERLRARRTATNPPHSPAAGSTFAGRPPRASPSATGSSTTTPRETPATIGPSRDSSRPKRRSAWTAGASGSEQRRGQPDRTSREPAARGTRRRARTRCAPPCTTRRPPSPAERASAPARKSANSSSAIPAISRLSDVFPRALPLPVWSELRDLSVLVDRNHGIRSPPRRRRRDPPRIPPRRALGRAPNPRRGDRAVAISFVDQRSTPARRR